CTSAPVPSARITTFSTTVPVLPEARASWGYGGITLDPDGIGGTASSGSAMAPPTCPPSEPPCATPPSSPAASPLPGSPYTATPLSSAGFASGAASFGISFGATSSFGGGGIVKSYTPDLPGDFSGGLVDIRLREFPERFAFSTSMSLGGNTQTTFQPFRTYRGGPLDYLGLGSNFRKLPERVPASVTF